MLSLVEHTTIAIAFLLIFHWLLNILHVKSTSRPAIEVLLWAIAFYVLLLGLWSPLM